MTDVTIYTEIIQRSNRFICSHLNGRNLTVTWTLSESLPLATDSLSRLLLPLLSRDFLEDLNLPTSRDFAEDGTDGNDGYVSDALLLAKEGLGILLSFSEPSLACLDNFLCIEISSINGPQTLHLKDSSDVETSEDLDIKQTSLQKLPAAKSPDLDSWYPHQYGSSLTNWVRRISTGYKTALELPLQRHWYWRQATDYWVIAMTLRIVYH